MDNAQRAQYLEYSARERDRRITALTMKGVDNPAQRFEDEEADRLALRRWRAGINVV